MNLFWHNWSILIMSWVGILVAWQLGYVQHLFSVDATYLTFVIFGLWNISTLWLVVLSYKVKNGTRYDEARFGPIWFMSDAYVSIGMIGTLIGFIMVLSTAFGDIDPSEVEQLKGVLATLATGMGTALTTTLVGLTSSLITKSMLVTLEEANARV